MVSNSTDHEIYEETKDMKDVYFVSSRLLTGIWVWSRSSIICSTPGYINYMYYKKNVIRIIKDTKRFSVHQNIYNHNLSTSTLVRIILVISPHNDVAQPKVLHYSSSEA